MKALFPLSLSIFVSFFLYPLVLGDNNHGVTFLFPTSGLTLSLNDTVNVTYTSNFSVPLLYTFCANATGDNITQELVENVAPFNSSQLVQLQWEQPICWFDLRPNSSAGFGANSPAVTILPTPRAHPSTVSLPQSSSTATPTSNVSGTPSSNPDTNSGLSSAAKAGIGVGVSLGVVGLIAAAVFGFIFLRRQNPSDPKSFAASDVSSSVDGNVEGKWPNYNKLTPPGAHEGPGELVQPQELLSDARYEMPAGETRQEMSSEVAVKPR